MVGGFSKTVSGFSKACLWLTLPSDFRVGEGVMYNPLSAHWATSVSGQQDIFWRFQSTGEMLRTWKYLKYNNMTRSIKSTQHRGICILF